MAPTKPQTIATLLSDAFLALEGKKFSTALKLAQKGLEHQPKLGALLYVAGLALLGLDQPKKAVFHLKKAVEADPAQLAPKSALARGYAAQNMWQEAISAYDAALLIAQTPDLVLDRARALDHLGQYQAALAVLAESLDQKGVLATSGLVIEGWLLLGVVAQKAGLAERAVAAFEQVVQLAPDHAGAWNNLGVAFRSQGRLRDAQSAFERAFHLRPNHAATLANLAQTKRLLNESDAAIWAGRAVEQDQNHPQALLELALALIAKGDEAGAEAILERLIRVAPKQPHGWYLLGKTRQALGKKAAAIGAFERVMDLDPADRHGASLALALLSDTLPDRAPRAYVAQLFDDYAERFDESLVVKLDYSGPAQLDAILAPYWPKGGKALDLGCGTGLMGPVLRPHMDHLWGVDLSAIMIEKAKDRGLYDRLDVGDLIDILADAAGLDLIIAADVFIYLGDLAPIFAKVSRALAPLGVFAFTVERAEAGLVLQESQRFAHGDELIRTWLAAAGLDELGHRHCIIRKDRGRDVPGSVWLARKALVCPPTRNHSENHSENRCDVL